VREPQRGKAETATRVNRQIDGRAAQWTGGRKERERTGGDEEEEYVFARCKVK
jgi:hypothetical protein